MLKRHLRGEPITEIVQRHAGDLDREVLVTTVDFAGIIFVSAIKLKSVQPPVPIRRETSRAVIDGGQ